MTGKYTVDGLKDVRNANREWLLEQPGVSGTSITGTEAEPAIKVIGNEIPAEIRDGIVARLGDAPVVFEDDGGGLTPY